MTDLTTQYDMDAYGRLAEQAAKARQNANERYQQAKADSETCALRELVFTAASYGVTRLLLEPSDQGPFMHVSEIEPQVDDEAEDIISDSGSYDLSDYERADWLAVVGVEQTEFNRRSEQIRQASIDIKVAIEALLTCDRHDGPWGQDETCARCTYDDGSARPFSDPGPVGPGGNPNVTEADEAWLRNHGTD